jgi:hypothetical protein
MLRMSVPDVLGQEPFLEFLSGFLKPQPLIRIDLSITNLFLDLGVNESQWPCPNDKAPESTGLLEVFGSRCIW